MHGGGIMQGIHSFDNLEQTKRDHKVMISEDAINKVRLINFRTIEKSDKILIQSLTKKALLKAMTQNDSNEVALTFRLGSLEEIGISFGNEHSVDVELDTISYHLLHRSEDTLDKDFYDCVIVVTHNHPSLSNLSVNDIQFFLQQDKLRIIVAVTNRGTCFYLEKLWNYDKAKAITLYNEMIIQFNKAENLKQKQSAVSFFLNNCYTCGINYGVR